MLETNHIKQKTTKTGIVDLFHAFCEHKFGFDAWKGYMENSEFAYAMTSTRAKYGDAIFRTLVDYVSQVEQVTVWNILADFSEFKNTYF